MRSLRILSIVVTLLMAQIAVAQSSSLLRLPRVRPDSDHSNMRTYAVQESSSHGFSAVQPGHKAKPATRAIEQVSLIAVQPREPRKFETNMLIKIVVRQHKNYESEGEYEAEKEWKLDALLSRWFRFHEDHKLGADALSAGNPGVKFDLKNEYETEGESERKDKFTTHITARIVDVKPNGNLVLEAKQTERHDDEEYTMTLTGICRSDDVTPDNTIMSTQIYNMVLNDHSRGAIKDATTRGWVPRILDFLKPF